jgi:glycosyltransferase involved in cell wall biosynthesis
LAKSFALPSLFFTHALVAGPRQNAYALALGFSQSRIIEGFLSADVEFFEAKHRAWSQIKKRRILYVGRLAPEKGLRDLLLAWDQISINDDWEFRVVGGTEKEWSALLKDTFQTGVAPNAISFSAFADSDLIAREMLEAAVFVLPSKYEPWGVVLHEAALCGCFLIATDKVGASDQLIQNEVNGLVCRSDSISIEASLRDVVSRDFSLVVDSGKTSEQLAKALNPNLTAKYLRQLV